MAGYILFPSKGSFFGKIRILCSHHYQLTKQWQCKSKRNPFARALSRLGTKIARTDNVEQ